MADMLELVSCRCCGSAVEPLIKLPGFPLTGIYAPLPAPPAAEKFDLDLVRCAACGHLQLGRHLPPVRLYGKGYAHRSTASHSAIAAADVLIEFIRKVAATRRFRSALEVGCNDLVLLPRLATLADFAVGVDPIWLQESPPDLERMRIIGRYIEDVDPQRDLPVPPDLVVSNHNLEHLHDPAEPFRRLLANADRDALFVIAVPDATTMIQHLRFDQVFHQHVHYFSLNSLAAWVASIGGQYLAHQYDPLHWGQTLILAFKRAEGSGGGVMPEAQPISHELIQRRFGMFQHRMQDSLEIMTGMEKPLVGYGAGQMVSAVAYHLGSDLGFFSTLLDDNPQRAGQGYPGLPVGIKLASEYGDFSKAAVVIMALDAVRPIMQRLLNVRPRAILVPGLVY
jgi:hypothetical protein